VTRTRRIVHDTDGLNTGEWPFATVDHFITPTDQFFTRSHAPVPGTLVCAGLRRDEYLGTGPLPGELPWGPEPVSTGESTGVSLADLFREVVPGWIGARSVKWLGRINLLAKPSDSYFQSQAYRVQREVDAAKPRDVSAGIAMRGVPLNAVILDPAPDQVVQAGPVKVRGWAMGSEARPLTRVELSLDSGQRWVHASITREGQPWTWSLWEATVELTPGIYTLAARATDSGGATQPSTVEETRNVKGYGNNAWHRVIITAR